MTSPRPSGHERVRYTDTATPLSEAATHCWYEASSLRLRSARDVCAITVPTSSRFASLRNTRHVAAVRRRLDGLNFGPAAASWGGVPHVVQSHKAELSDS